MSETIPTEQAIWRDIRPNGIVIVRSGVRWRRLARPHISEISDLVGGGGAVRWRRVRRSHRLPRWLVRCAVAIPVAVVTDIAIHLIAGWEDPTEPTSVGPYPPDWWSGVEVGILCAAAAVAVAWFLVTVTPHSGSRRALNAARIGLFLYVLELLVVLMRIPSELRSGVPHPVMREVASRRLPADAPGRIPVDAWLGAGSPVLDHGEVHTITPVGQFHIGGRPAEMAVLAVRWPLDLVGRWTRRKLVVSVDLSSTCGMSSHISGATRELWRENLFGRTVVGESLEVGSAWEIRIFSDDIGAWRLLGPQLQALLIELPQLHFGVRSGVLSVSMGIRDARRFVGGARSADRASRLIDVACVATQCLADVLERQRIP